MLEGELAFFDMLCFYYSRSIEKKIERMAASGNDEMQSLWKRLLMQRYLAGRMVRREVDKMSKAYFHRQDLSNVDMEKFIDLVAQFDAGNTTSGDNKFKVRNPSHT